MLGFINQYASSNRPMLPSMLAISFVGAVGASPAAAQFSGFDPVVWHTTSEDYSGQWTSATGDFNGDGRADVVVVPVIGDIGILLAQPDGSFELASVAFDYAQEVEPADLDGDGVLDLAILTFSYDMSATNDVVFYKGLGDGTFMQMSTAGVSTRPVSLVVADFDQDDLPDVAVADRQGFIHRFKNFGNFQIAFREYISVINNPTDIVASDVTGDGACDLILSTKLESNPGSVVVMVNDGEGNAFSQGDVYPVGVAPDKLHTADLNNDGSIDLVAKNALDNEYSILMADGAGGFRPEERLAPPSAGPNLFTTTEDAVFTDLNGDGRLDMVMAVKLLENWSIVGHRFYVYLGDGAGKLNFMQSYDTEYVVGLHAIEHNGDYSPDLVLVQHASRIGIARNLMPLSPPTPFELLTPANHTVGLPLPSDLELWSTAAATLDWSDSAGFHRTYDLTIKRLGVNEQVVHTATGLIHSRYEIPAGVLTPGRRYQWTVTARNAVGVVLPSTTESFEFTTTIAPDLNTDGTVNGADLANLLSNWGLVNP